MCTEDGTEVFKNWPHQGEIVRAAVRRKPPKSTKAHAGRADVPRAALGAPAKPSAAGRPSHLENEVAI
jgi:hypothetical protein